jgi:hypothetical protein
MFDFFFFTYLTMNFFEPALSCTGDLAKASPTCGGNVQKIKNMYRQFSKGFLSLLQPVGKEKNTRGGAKGENF